MTTEVTTTFDLGDITRIKRMFRRPSDIGAKVAKLYILKDATRSFQLQRLGDFKWKQRYPTQDDPFINIAGAVQDLNRGREPLPRRFQRRPALIDTRTLAKSIGVRAVSENTVEVGSVLPYAKYHQWGLKPPPIRIKSQARDTLEAMLKKKKWRDNKAVAKLKFITRENELRFNRGVVQRPFIGLTDESRKKIPIEIERLLTEEAEKA